MTERQVRDLLEEQCRKHGSEGPAFDTIVLFGRRSALPHGVPTNARLRDGDFVLFDFGCTIDGLRSDITRTFVKGTASARQRQVYRTVQEAQRLARRGVRARVSCATVDRLAREHIDRAGFAQCFGHATGHGVGYRIHEGPRVSATAASRLPEGCVVTVEPGIYIPSLGGVRIEDMVCVTRTGARILTGFPRRLMEI
jgi:Xaa-Pro aminopeptidase